MKTEFNFESLADLAPGQRARVVSIEGHDAVSRRLRALGLRPKTAIAAIRRAPLGDPVVYELRGYRLCLRSEEARRVRVEATA